MSYLDFLRKGSSAHKAEVRSPNAIMILPVGEDNKDCMAFQEVVADAIAHSSEGYEVLPHRNFQRDLRGWRREVYDCAAITWES
jgi:hypothetical protein